jgi:hypothetical protein
MHQHCVRAKIGRRWWVKFGSRLTLRWFKDEEGKKEVAETLKQKGLDHYDIEADAIRTSSSSLELLDRMLASLELRSTRSALKMWNTVSPAAIK